MLKQSLSQKLLQKLSPQQIQFIKLLELNTLNFEQKVEEELNRESRPWRTGRTKLTPDANGDEHDYGEEFSETETAMSLAKKTA